MRYHLDQELFHAKELQAKDGYTWTITSLLGEILQVIEELFGPRDKSFTVLGVEFGTSNPKIWFPRNCKNVIIQLSYPAAQNMEQACYQMAHECIHLLNPGMNANNLEEGLAVYFASEYMKVFRNSPMWHATNKSYVTAQRIVSKIMTENMECIKKLRELEPSLSKVTIDQLKTLDAVKCLSDTECNFLLDKFIRD